jgi:hypothetical protein
MRHGRQLLPRPSCFAERKDRTEEVKVRTVFRRGPTATGDVQDSVVPLAAVPPLLSRKGGETLPSARRYINRQHFLWESQGADKQPGAVGSRTAARYRYAFKSSCHVSSSHDGDPRSLRSLRRGSLPSEDDDAALREAVPLAQRQKFRATYDRAKGFASGARRTEIVQW